MKKLTKKSLDELAKTMSVIDGSEQDTYWGKYENDCFWRCVAFLKTGEISEEAAASWADNFFVSEYGSNGSDHLLSTGDSSITGVDMYKALTNFSVTLGSNANMVILSHTSALEFYKNNPNITPSANHCLILSSVSSGGTYIMFDPQNNTSFTITSQTEKDKLTKFYIN